jgi:cysteine-rich repeat protein
VTPTPTGTVVFAPVCGNGIIEVGEQCDDGNANPGDACPADCKYTAGNSAIRGRATGPTIDRTGCQVEWYVVNPNNPSDSRGLPNRTQTCHDGDPTCDVSGFDSQGAPIPDQTPGWCRFQLVMCVNNQDAKLPKCVPNGISQILLVQPVLRARKTEQQTARAALQDAASTLLDPSNPGAGYVNAAPLSATQQNLCSAPFEIDILLGRLKRSSVSVITSSATLGARPLRNRSTLLLTCKAAGTR